jgi:hypothetical protein
VAWWYLPHYNATIAYIRSTTSGPLSLGTGPTNPLTLSALEGYFTALINQHVGWAVVFVCLLGLVFGSRRVARSVRRSAGLERRDVLLRLALPVTWLVPAVLIQAASTLQDQRLVAPALCGAALLGGAAIANTPWRGPRLVAIVAVAVFGLWPLLMHTFGPNSSDLSTDEIQVSTPVGDLFAVFGNGPVGYEVAPAPVNHALTVVDWLLAERRSHQIAGPITVGVLATDPELNGNTFHWLDLQNGNTTRLITVEPLRQGESPAQIRAEFATYTAVVTFSSVATAVSGRAGILNGQIVTTAESLPYLKAFTGPAASFPISAGRARVLWR